MAATSSDKKFNQFIIAEDLVSDLNTKNAETSARMKAEETPGGATGKKGLAKAASTVSHGAHAVAATGKEAIATLVNFFTPSFDASPKDLGDNLARAKNAIKLFGASMVAIRLSIMNPNKRAALIAKLKRIAGIKAEPAEIKAWLGSSGTGGLEPIRKSLNESCVKTVDIIRQIRTATLDRAIENEITLATETKKEKEAGAEGKTENFDSLFGNYIFEETPTSTGAIPKEETNKDLLVQTAVASIADPVAKAIAGREMDLSKLMNAKDVLKNLSKRGGNLVSLEIHPYDERVYGHHLVFIRTPNNYSLGGGHGDIIDPLKFADLSIVVKSDFFQKNKELFFNQQPNPELAAEKLAFQNETEYNGIVQESENYAQRAYTLCCGATPQVMLINNKPIADSDVAGFLNQLTKAINDSAKPNPAFAWFNPIFFQKFAQINNTTMDAVNELSGSATGTKTKRKSKIAGTHENVDRSEEIKVILDNAKINDLLPDDDISGMGDLSTITSKILTNSTIIDEIKKQNPPNKDPKVKPKAWGYIKKDNDNMIVFTTLDKAKGKIKYYSISDGKIIKNSSIPISTEKFIDYANTILVRTYGFTPQ